ncbi:MAG: patatin-like phospholipase family protein [Gammaproteobacteria bacterium]|nr:patatin-like phospholipase family protein [Gammaproteobacteria bacterium]
MNSGQAGMAGERALALSLCVLMALPLPAASAEEPSPTVRERPRIGLVLGGGGAKGAAHIGVLRVLDELRVPVDCIAGTSMGALIGGTFASGMPAEDIERAVLGIDWTRTVGTEGLRDRTPIHRKLAGLTYTNNLELGIRAGSLTVPGGLLKSQDIEDVIRGLVSDARFTRDFDRLPIPFRAVATDMLAGEMVVLDRGDLSVAMRASMAVPGAFAPVVVDGQVLSDGGMMRNLPVDIARGLCADVVIAVWLASPPPQAGDLDSAVALASRSLDVMIDANQKAQIATLGERDVGIVVPMGDIGSADFDRVPEAIPLGRAAAEGMREQLRRYAVPAPAYQAWRQAVTQGDGTTIRLAAVEITGLGRVNPEYVRAQLRQVRSGAEVTPAQVTEDTGRIFALGDFERVEYRFTGPREARTLEIRAVEKSWGPDFVRFDLGLAANGNGTLQALLRADHERTWMNPRGGEWHNTLQLGQQTLVATDFYQPLDVRQRFFVQPMARFERDLEDIYLDSDRVARYELREAYGQIDAGVNFGTRAQLRAGLRSGLVSATVDTGPPFLPETDDEGDSSAIVRLLYDTRDAVGLPTRGTLLNVRYVHSGSWLGGEQDYDLVEGVLVKSFPWRGDALSLLAGGGAELDGELPANQEFQLGGIRTFPGLQRGELRGDDYWYVGTSYLWKLADIQSLFGQAVYAGLRLQAGRMGERIDAAVVDDGTLYGIAGSLGGRTPIGPFIISLGIVDNSEWQLQFAVGRPIAEGSIFDEIR